MTIAADINFVTFSNMLVGGGIFKKHDTFCPH